ncbi:very-short-patch-repair endonuclease [Mesorhizobium sp. USDA 4775]
MGHDLVPSRQRRNAKSMRRVMTDAELKLWNELRAHRLMEMSFRRQVPIGPYIVDFACSAHRLIVEVDGSQHADAEHLQYDEARSVYLKASGLDHPAFLERRRHSRYRQCLPAHRDRGRFGRCRSAST